MVEHPELNWSGRLNYLAAKTEERQIDVYAMDLVWGIARQYYAGLPMPSELWSDKNKIDRRTGKEILSDMLKGLGGE